MLPNKHIYVFITWALAALLITFQIYRVANTPIWVDDSLFAAVAKNLVSGDGYSTAYYNTLIPFAAGINAGPVIIIPSAIMILLFGNGYWVPGLTAVLLISSLLLLLFHQLKPILAVLRWQCAAFFLLSVMLLTNHEIGFPNENMMIWYKLLGEVPSAFLVISATLCIAKSPHNSNAIFSGGIIIGLAGLCKLQALIGGGALGIYLAISLMTASNIRMPWRFRLKNLCLYGVGVFLPLAAFESVKIMTLGVAGYVDLWKHLLFAIRNFHHARLSFIGTKLLIMGEYFGIVPVHFDSQDAYQESLHLLIIIIFLTVFLAVIFYILHHIRRQVAQVSPSRWAAEALLFSALVHVAWWVSLGVEYLPRHSTQGIIYGCAALALLVSHITARDAYKGNAIFAGLAILFLFARSDAAEEFWKKAPHKESLAEDTKVEQLLLAMQNAGIQNHEPDTLFFACGDTVEMEYLLPKSGNFIHCNNLFNPAFAHRKRALVLYSVADRVTIDSPIDKNNLTLSFSTFDKIGFSAQPVPGNVRKICPKNDIYVGKNYFMASCRRG